MSLNSPNGGSEAPLRSGERDNRFAIELMFATSRSPASAEMRSNHGTVRVRMTSQALERVASMLAADGNGVLATGETVPTLTTRLDAVGSAQRDGSGTTRNFAAGPLPSGPFKPGGKSGNMQVVWRRRRQREKMCLAGTTGAPPDRCDHSVDAMRSSMTRDQRRK